MAYNDTPLPNETPAQSQPLMRQNFQQIATSYNTDHVPLSSGTNVGMHTKVDFASPLSPFPTSAPNQSVAFIATQNGKTELFYNRDGLTPNIFLSGVKAFGIFSGFVVAGAIAVNCVVSKTGTGNYLVTMNAGVLNTAIIFMPVVSGQMTSNVATGCIIGIDSVNSPPGTFQINCRALSAATPTDVSYISFIVLQS